MPPLTVMIKPASSMCNMRCAYCFYADVSAHRTEASFGLMSLDTLETLVRRAFAYAEDSIHFAFQGGEPLLAGLKFFERLIALQRQYNTRCLQVHNAIQTNGMLVDDNFAAFFGKHRFLVGVSVDGDASIHDALRRDSQGNGTHQRVMGAIALLKKHQVAFNILCVVSESVAREPERTFEALAPYEFLQFIPCLDGFDGVRGPYSLTEASFTGFMKTIFDLYERSFQRGKLVSVREFDNYIQMLMGYPPEQCSMCGVCGRYFLVEADGSVYPCDFYVLDQWKLGNIRDESFVRMARSPLVEAFVDSSRRHSAQCDGCKWFGLCRGGCKREREPFDPSAPEIRRFCAGYQEFFDYAYDRMKGIAAACVTKT